MEHVTCLTNDYVCAMKNIDLIWWWNWHM